MLKKAPHPPPRLRSITHRANQDSTQPETTHRRAATPPPDALQTPQMAFLAP